MPPENETTKPVERDFTAEQNERVLPMVKEVLGALGSFPLEFSRDDKPESAEAERASLRSFIITEYMPRAMDKGLQQTDVPMTFKLMGLVVEMLRGRAMTPDNEADVRLTNAAQQILKALGEEPTLRIDFHADSSNPEQAGLDRANLYTELYKKVVLKALEDHQIQVNEVSSVFDIMATIMLELQNKVTETIDNARKVAEAKMWGVEDIDNITVLDIHQKAIVPVETIKEGKVY